MVTLAPLSGLIKVIGRGGTRRMLHSHTMALINAPGPASTYLPQNLKREDFQVFFSNALPADINFAEKKFTRVRRQQIDDLADFTIKNNLAYANAQRLQGVINKLDDNAIVPESSDDADGEF